MIQYQLTSLKHCELGSSSERLAFLEHESVRTTSGYEAQGSNLEGNAARDVDIKQMHLAVNCNQLAYERP